MLTNYISGHAHPRLAGADSVFWFEFYDLIKLALVEYENEGGDGGGGGKGEGFEIQ